MPQAYDVYQRTGEVREEFYGTYEGDEETIIETLVGEGVVGDNPEVVREGRIIYLDYEFRLIPARDDE